jgi:hypothetical protein
MKVACQARTGVCLEVWPPLCGRYVNGSDRSHGATLLTPNPPPLTTPAPGHLPQRPQAAGRHRLQRVPLLPRLLGGRAAVQGAAGPHRGRGGGRPRVAAAGKPHPPRSWAGFGHGAELQSTH